MFALALVHMFPFIMHSISEDVMVEQWRTIVFYWTGVMVLLSQGYLQIMCLPWIRSVECGYLSFQDVWEC